MTGSDGTPMQNDADEARSERARDPRRSVRISGTTYDEDDVPHPSDVEDL